jgi:hypothetical protein
MKEIKTLLFDIEGVLAMGSNLKNIRNPLGTKDINLSVARKIKMKVVLFKDNKQLFKQPKERTI